jgi:hypothetical protein
MKTKNKGRSISLKLEISPDLNFELIGISSHENDYRLVWAINKKWNVNFVRIDNLVLQSRREGCELEFGRFHYADEERLLAVYLISNRCPDGFLFREIKNMDFLVQIIGEMERGRYEDMLRSLKDIEIISGAYAIDPKSLKGISRIIPS